MAYGDLPLDAPLKPNKGKEGGACNRQSCQAEPALWFNHGMAKWYCGDCARDIGGDEFNRRHWNSDWRPRLGHDQFETRRMIRARDTRRQAETVQHGSVRSTGSPVGEADAPKHQDPSQ